MRIRHAVTACVAVAATLLPTAACGPNARQSPPPGSAAASSGSDGGDAAGRSVEPATAARALGDGERRIDARVDSLDALLKPIGLLRPAEIASLRRYLSSAHMRSARRLGIRAGLGVQALDSLRQAGRLERLPDSTELFIVRDLDHSQPLLTPAAATLLRDIARRFQARLDTMGLPALRLEVTSALRTATDQAALRDSNPNAATGTSAHEYGTTFDIAYSAFAAPARPVVEVRPADALWAAPFLDRYAAVAADALGGRRSHELEAILGRLLVTMQARGQVMVTRESLEPVFHLTVR